jgi:hypothetical protein
MLNTMVLSTRYMEISEINVPIFGLVSQLLGMMYFCSMCGVQAVTPVDTSSYVGEIPNEIKFGLDFQCQI